jgi:sirohydrochlorin cobaltochelatase
MTDAIILFSHGSVLCGAGETLAATAAAMQQRGDAPIVEVGYLNYSEPSFHEAFDACVARGAKQITVVPYFLAAGYFAGVALPREVEKAKLRHPSIEVRVADAMRFHSLLADALLACADRAAPPAQWGRILQSAHDHCRANPECPLFGSEPCTAMRDES